MTVTDRSMRGSLKPVFGYLAGLACILPTAAFAITGGKDCSDGIRRHVVQLIGPGGEYCSGTVVGPRKVVTAAHCFRSNAPRKWAVVGPDLGKGRKAIPVAAIRIHPAFDRKALMGDARINDIAVVTLAEAVPKGMIPARIGGGALRKGEVTVAGYGGEILREVTLRAKDQPLTSNGNAILAAVGAGACTGDSGGPVFRKAGKGWLLVGVVSWTQGACGSITAVTPLDDYRSFLSGTR